MRRKNFLKNLKKAGQVSVLISALALNTIASTSVSTWADDLSISQEDDSSDALSINDGGGSQEESSRGDSLSISHEDSPSSSIEISQESGGSSRSNRDDNSVRIRDEGKPSSESQSAPSAVHKHSDATSAQTSNNKAASKSNQSSRLSSGSSGASSTTKPVTKSVRPTEEQRRAARTGNTAQTNRSIASSPTTAQPAVQKPVTTATITTTASRKAILDYAFSFSGGSYVWGGDDPHTGADCSGFVRYVYNKFGVSLPRTAHEQALVGQKIAAKDAQPGDLIFYMDSSGYIYHVVMYAGNGKTIEAKGHAYGIGSFDVNYSKACWACRYVNDAPAKTLTKAEGQNTATTASSLMEIGRKAYEGDEASQKIIANVLGRIAQSEKNIYGFAPSVLVAQVIQESGWLSFQAKDRGGIQPEDNNILGMNTDLLNDKWTSPWDGSSAMRNVPQYVNGTTKSGYESMRTYDDIEECMYDYSAFKIGLHPELKGETNVDKVIEVGLKGYATDPNYQQKIKNIITKYNLTQFD